jgi:hypothetical protein
VQPTQTKTVEEEAYCPPTPLPKKSILKDPNSTTDKSSKQVKKTQFLFLKKKSNKTGPSRKRDPVSIFGKGVLISD